MSRTFYALKEQQKGEVIFLYIDDTHHYGASNLTGISPSLSPRVYDCVKINRAQFHTYRAFGIPEYTPAAEELHFVTYD